MAQSADSWQDSELGRVCAPSRATSTATPSHHPFLVIRAVAGEFCLRNRVQQFCTLGSVRGEVTVGHGEPKRARCRKRPTQPRGYLRTESGFLYSDRAKLSLGEEEVNMS
jgi:hypothetical protein